MTYRAIHFHRRQFKEEAAMKVFGFPDSHQIRDPWSDAPAWALEIGLMLAIVIGNQEDIMSTIADLTSTLDSIGAKVTTVKTDVETLLAKLGSGSV